MRQLTETKDAILKLGVEFQESQNHLAGARTAIENLTKTVEEKDKDIAMCHAELTEQHRLLTSG